MNKSSKSYTKCRTEMKNYTALKRISLLINDTINLHEHVIQKDTLSMTIYCVKKV